MFGLSVGAPSAEPISLAKLKAHLRVDHDAEDELIAALGIAAREMTEAEARRVWTARTVTLTLADWPCDGGAIELPTPAAAITTVQYYATNGTLTTLAGCQPWLTCSPPLVYPPANTSWPGLQSGKVAPVIVTYTAGTAAAAVPEMAKAAIRLAVADWYENRGDAKSPHEQGLPAGAVRLCGLLRTGDYP